MKGACHYEGQPEEISGGCLQLFEGFLRLGKGKKERK